MAKRLGDLKVGDHIYSWIRLYNSVFNETVNIVYKYDDDTVFIITDYGNVYKGFENDDTAVTPLDETKIQMFVNKDDMIDELNEHRKSLELDLKQVDDILNQCQTL